MFAACLLALTLAASPGPHPPASALRTGDLVFQTSRSAQSRPIQQATGSRWSHVGLVEVDGRGRVFVVEAISPVSRTPYSAWAARGEGGEVLALRPREVAPAARARAVAEAKRHLGKPYDLAFAWGDDRLYCSELVRKAYARGGGVKLGRMERLGDLATGGLEAAIRARFGEVPRDLLLVTPASLAADPGLARVEP